jgi:hypothetical protein
MNSFEAQQFSREKPSKDILEYLVEYLELEEGDKRSVEIIKAIDLPKDCKEQLSFFNDESLGSINIAFIPEKLWIKGAQPSESHADKNLVLFKEGYLEEGDDIAWLSHEIAHCQRFLDGKNYQKESETPAFKDISFENSYPNNKVEKYAFTKQFEFLKSKGKSRKDILEMVLEHYKEEDLPFFEKILDEIDS